MRYLALLLAAAGGLFSSERAEAAPVRAFQSGSWEGTAYYRDDNGALSLCSARTHDANGTSLSIILRPGGSWSLLFVKPDGFSSAAGQYRLYADGRLLHLGAATAENDGRILKIDLPSADGLRHGSILHVLSNEAAAAFSLKGSAEALAELERCSKAESRPTIPSAGDGPRPMPRNELLLYAKKILDDAGYVGYRFLPERTGGEHEAVVWRFEDGSLGSLAATERSAADDIGAITAAQGETCKGMFSIREIAPRFVNGAAVRQDAASCEAGAHSFHTESVLVRMPDGFLVRLTSESRAAQGEKMASSEALTRALAAKH